MALTLDEIKMNFASGQRYGTGFGLTPFESSPGYQAMLTRTSGGGTPAAGGGFGLPGGVPTSTGNAGSIEALTAMVNEINQRAQQTANAGRIPGGAALEEQSSGNIGSALRGEVDQDVINLLGQQAAERGVSTGSPMGPGSNADYLRSLGLTSLERMNTGQSWLSAATARNPAAPIYDAGNQVLTAGQLQQAILAREQMANQLRIAQIQASRSRGGGGFSGGGARPPSGPSTNWADMFNSGGATPQAPFTMFPPTTSFDSPGVYPGQATSLYDMGGDYFSNTLSNYGTPPTAPTSLMDSGWDDLLNNYFYNDSGSAAPAPTSLMDSGWDDYFNDYGG